MSMNMEEFNLKCKKIIEENWEENKEKAKDYLAYMDSSTAKYHGDTIYSLYMPKMFSTETAGYIKTIAETMYGILIKVMKEYLEKEDYRKLFNFAPKLEAMIRNTPKYENLLPIARVDIFLNEKDLSFKFCEFNADGTSSMNEDRELNHAFERTALYQELSKEYTITSFELFDSWAKEFKKIYETYENKVENPHVAIVDFLELGCSMYEFEEFRKAFERAGFTAEVCEIRDLRYDGQHLYSKTGKIVDAIYRRAVTSDILEHEEEVKDFLQAVQDHKVCLVGSFCTHIIHDKILFYLLHLERTHAFLTSEEVTFIKEHIPYTVTLCDEEIEKSGLLTNKNGWIIKPKDSYGARGVFAGVNFTEEQWERIVAENKNGVYIMQEFVMPYQSYNIDYHKAEPAFRKYSNLTGLYVYNGKFAGVYSRQADHEIISSAYDENDIATLVIAEK